MRITSQVNRQPKTRPNNNTNQTQNQTLTYLPYLYARKIYPIVSQFRFALNNQSNQPIPSSITQKVKENRTQILQEMILEAKETLTQLTPNSNSYKYLFAYILQLHICKNGGWVALRCPSLKSTVESTSISTPTLNLTPTLDLTLNDNQNQHNQNPNQNNQENLIVILQDNLPKTKSKLPFKLKSKSIPIPTFTVDEIKQIGTDKQAAEQLYNIRSVFPDSGRLEDA